MKPAKCNRLLSLALALLMVFFCFPVTALGNDEETVSESTGETSESIQEVTNTVDEEEFFGEEEEFIPWELELEEGDLSLSELKTAVLNPSETPEIISAALIEEKQHVNRLYEQEPDIFTIMFQNRDGGKTTYIFSHPVKTISPNGAYTDMTAAQIQAVVNSTANTNATAQTSSSLSLTASGNKIQINLGSDFIKSRLGNLDAENPIMSYNIGEFVIFKAGVSTLPNGITTPTYNVTEEAREWATPGSELPKFTFTPETDDMQMDADDNVSLGGSIGTITPIVEEEIVVMSVTYSVTSGQYSLKSISDNKYLTCATSGILLAPTTLISPEGKWHFQYLGSSNYYIIPMARQNMFLSYYEDSLCLLPQADNEDDPQPTIWTIDLISNNTGYIYTSDDMYISSSLNMIPGVEENLPVWQLGTPNDAELLTSISITNIMVQPGESIGVPTITKNPEITAYTSSDDYFEWVSLDSEEIGYDSEEGFFVNETYGVYRIYCRYVFNPEIVSNTAVIIVSDDYDITSGAVYLIRPYAATITDSTKLLTMNVGTSSNTLSLSSWATDWNTLSQAFTITNVGLYTYKISAILSTNQYDVPFTSPPYTGEYSLPNKDEKTNTIAMSSTSLQLSTYTGAINQKWYIYCKDGQYHFVNAFYPQYQLTYSTANNNVSVSSSSANSGWITNYVGIDVPCIKQTKDYYCGIASPLQILYGKNVDTVVNSTMTLPNLMQHLDTYYANTITQNGADLIQIKNILNHADMLGAGAYDYAYRDSFSTFNLRISSAIEQGDPVLVKVKPKTVYGSGWSSTHYICVIGYDVHTERAIVSDCTYNSNQFGIHSIPISSLYNGAITSSACLAIPSNVK